MTPQQVITEVRRLIQDTATPYRYSDTDLLGFVNLTLRRMAMLRPDLFIVYGDIPTQANQAMQQLPEDAIRLVEIFSVKGGNVVHETVREMLDASHPGWQSETAGTPTNYIRHVRNPNRFFLSPPPASGVVLKGEYVQSPPSYKITQTIELLPDTYLPVVVDGTVYLAESVDNEHANSGRATAHMQMFESALGVSLRGRTITDTEMGGLGQNAN